MVGGRDETPCDLKKLTGDTPPFDAFIIESFFGIVARLPWAVECPTVVFAQECTLCPEAFTPEGCPKGPRCEKCALDTAGCWSGLSLSRPCLVNEEDSQPFGVLCFQEQLPPQGVSV